MLDSLTLYVNENLVTEFLRIVLTYGVAGAFACATLLILISYAIFKGLSLLNNSN